MCRKSNLNQVFFVVMALVCLASSIAEAANKSITAFDLDSNGGENFADYVTWFGEI